MTDGQPTKSAPRDRLNHDQRILLMALAGGLPGTLISLILIWDRPYTPKVQWTLSLVILGFWLSLAFSLRGRVVRHLQTLSNLLAAMREGDYSIRARGAGRDDALGDVMLEVNALGETLRAQRLGALEATALLRTVMGEIDVAVFAFDAEARLRLVNRAGERLFAQPAGRLLGRTAAELGLEEFLHSADDAQIIPKTFPGQAGRWGVRRSTFRERGLPHQLLVLSDLSRALREEEREAWKRLVRVLGHELNNSLTPIKSIAGSLESLLVREPRPLDWHDDMARGLSIIGSRSESLSRFMQAYAHLARLPTPRFAPVNVHELVRRVAELETRLHVKVMPGAELTIQADADQLEQLLINLQRNAADAALQTGGGVSVGWIKNTNHVTLIVEDEGTGLSNTANLFVPFFTTKPGGSGIGLVLSRQIAEAHGGTLTLTNRRRGTGCEARLQLPL
ncbi:MAG: two-component system, NtrC family, nitrogen regulation sensor histidine kinase NtrY [Pyrinomonadaceae bacterium]|jgi:nitrogen fixation/metabolism regulation signal transduction histidine kinase|nr:two-component system, NtrC family, nitrogen regulation sensor histidine kinase NtrY [Pyrinomonadaceae bacterium]